MEQCNQKSEFILQLLKTIWLQKMANQKTNEIKNFQISHHLFVVRVADKSNCTAMGGSQVARVRQTTSASPVAVDEALIVQWVGCREIKTDMTPMGTT